MPMPKKFTSTAIFFVLLPDHSDACFNPKNASETNAVNITLLPIGHPDKRTNSGATDVV